MSAIGIGISPVLSSGIAAEVVPFSPADIAGLYAWHEYSQEVYQSTGGAIAGVGDPVGHWGDLSGVGNHLLALAASEPTLQSNGIVFDGVDDSLSAAIAAITRPFTMFLVAQYAAGTTIGTDLIITAPGGGSSWGIYMPSHANGRVGLTNGALMTITAGIVQDTPYIITANITTFVGIIGVNDSEDSGLCGGNTAYGSHRLALSSVATYQPCIIKAMIAYNATLNAAQRQQVRDYLNALYEVY